MSELVSCYLSEIAVQQGRLVLDDLGEGAVVVMHPMVMKRTLSRATAEQRGAFSKGSSGSGWTVYGMPIYRSYDIPGPSVLSGRVAGALKGDILF